MRRSRLRGARIGEPAEPLDPPGVDPVDALLPASRPGPAGQVDVLSTWTPLDRWPANEAIVCTSQPIRARSVRHRRRVACVENRGRSAASASRRTIFDQLHSVSGWPWLRRDSDRNSGPLARLMAARCRR